MRKLFTCLLISLLPYTIIAQSRTVSGVVTSSEDNLPLPGVNVVVQGTSKGTATDVNGAYSLELAPEENALVFSFVGFLSQTVTVGAQTKIDVHLQVDSKTLDEIVVIGYGTVAKSDLTGSVSALKNSDITPVPAVSALQSLQGKVPGVQITSGSGAPGSSPVVRIRGTGTFGDSDPIYVVDNVILDDISFLSANDIESWHILKDASATAIYGSRGANGVIIVTTKKGKKGQEPVISFSANYSIQKLQKQIDVLSGREFAIIANEITPGSFNNVDAVPNTEWQDELFTTAPMQEYQFSFTGSSDKAQYYVGLSYFNQQGIIPKSSYERITLKFNNTFHLTDVVRLGTNLSITPYTQQNTHGGAPFDVYRAQPVLTPRRSDGSYTPVPGVGNVFAAIEYTNSFDQGIRSVGNVFGEVDILKGLRFKTSFGVDMEYRKSDNFTPEFFVSPLQNNSVSDLNKSYGDRLLWLWENTFNYDKDIGKHRIGAVAGYTMQGTASENLGLVGENILRENEDFWYINRDNIQGQLVSNTVDPGLNYSMISYLARVNYTYDNRYLFTATWRNDGSSKFAEGNRYAQFPSFALGWNVINEAFMADVDLLSNLKVRASAGVIGNEKIDYTKQYSRVSNGVGAVFGNAETVYPGSTYGEAGNPDLVWEETAQIDLGVEIGFFEDKLTAEIDYYNKKTSGILIALPVPGFLGQGDGGTITYNAAEVLNRGFEYSLAWQSTVNDFRYRVGTVGTTIHNEALEVFGTGGENERLLNGNQTTATSPGDPLGSFYGYVTDGVFQSQAELDAYPHQSQAQVGDLRFVDVNNDGVLSSADRTNLGSPIPTFFYGINLSLGYKSFDLSADFQGQSGNKIYNAKETVRPDLYNFEQHVFDRWTGPGTSDSEPRATAGGYNWQPSTRFIQDGSYFRLRTIQLGYRIPAPVASKAKMKSARVFVSGTNIFTVTDFTGYSPEVAGGGPLDASIDNSTYPVSAIYTAGLNFTF